nr:ABC transporter ATP-binding protein [Acidilobus sp.]
MSLNAIEVVGLSKSYGKVVALEDVSLEVREGELVSLLGPNGAG